ncbi:MAG: nucleotidyltransferase substrate binding protein [Deltaproteobacteria bacterium]|nr:nucleotidyltransferase substrate binding protein [Deltaproteobacteria bacterium]
MSNADEIRWQQRFINFEKAMAKLEAACAVDEYSDLERAGLVKTFEFSFELAWKTLKDLLFYEGYEEKTPREVLRRAFEAGYLDDAATETVLDALDKRNLLSHTYDEDAAAEAVGLIKNRFAPVLRAILTRLKEKRAST